MIVSTQRLRYGMVRPSICTGRSRAPRGQRRDEVRPARRARVVVRIQELTARFTKTEASERSGRGRSTLLLQVGNSRERQSGAGFPGGDEAAAAWVVGQAKHSHSPAR
jgi:hypothetical protein